MSAPGIVAAIAAPPRRPSLLRRLLRHAGATIGAGVLSILVLTAIFAPLIAPYAPDDDDLGPNLSPPDLHFLFGLDLQGRDIFSRVVWGGQYSLSVGVSTVLFALVVGTVIGIAVAYAGGRVDQIGARAIDVALGFPAIVLSILIVAVLGVGLVNVVLAVGVSQTPRFARIVRGAALVVKQQPYVEAARAIGAGHLRIMLHELLPNIGPTLIVLGTLNLGDAVLSTATLSFLGLGAQPPAPEWGAMLNSGREYMRYAPWMMIFPGLALFLTVMSVNLLGDRLSEILDPRAAGRN
jgi:ABC-type dipeptide/oligopeptide/nickel transport system permease subunit